MNTRKLAVIVTLAALSIGTNYAMISLYNVKLMDLIVFVGGFCFGPLVGASIGIASWAIYGTLNPIGFSMPIWAATMFSESIYGIVGGLVRKTLDSHKITHPRREPFGVYVFFGTIGLLLTFLYDAITNTVFGYVANMPFLFAILTGFVPFGIIHVMSNVVFFGLGCVPVINAISSVTGGKNVDIPKK